MQTGMVNSQITNVGDKWRSRGPSDQTYRDSKTYKHARSNWSLIFFGAIVFYLK